MAAERATTKGATLARDQVKKNIINQAFPWEPLKAATIARKGSSKILIDKGDLVHSITFKMLTPYAAFIGVLRTARRSNGQGLVNIARVHEFGFMGYVTNTVTGTRYLLRIPARSFLRATLDQLTSGGTARGRLFDHWHKEVVQALQRSIR